MNKNELAHFGILGMHWGIHRTPEQLSRGKGYVDTTSSIVKEAKNINNSVANIRSTAKRQSLDKITDQELRDRVNRMNLEQQYTMLSGSQTSKGQSYVKNILEVGGSALAITSSALAIALAIKQLKSK